MATTKTPKSSTASESRSRSGTARPAAKKAGAKKAVAKKPAAKPVAAVGTAATRKSASKPGKAVLANREAAKRAKTVKTAKTATKATAKTVAKKPRAATPVATPPQPQPRKGKKVAVPNDIVERLRLEARRALDELKAKDVVELDVRGKTSIADYIVVASGTSTRHVKSIADEVVRYAKKAGMQPLGVEGQREAEWVLVDLGDIIVHIMLPRVREFYGLERLWSVGGDADAEAAAYA